MTLRHRAARLIPLLAITVVSVLMLALIAPGSEAAKKGRQSDSKRLQREVTVRGMKQHLEALQNIAVANEGHRASGFAGYDASVDYVEERLEAADWTTTRQPFDFDVFIVNAPAVLEQTQPAQVTYTEGEDHAYMDYSGSGDVTAGVTNVDLDLPPPAEPGSDSGCEPEDFAGFPAGDIALIQRGTCTFEQKAQNAFDAEASAAIIFNEGQEGRTEVVAGTLGGEIDPNFPVLGLSFARGNEFAAIPDLQLHVVTDTTVETRSTENLIAETTRGNPDNVVMAGAHLDSVLEGPGINDNGSGSAALIEIAEQISKLKIRPENRLRFAWWGAEESGLVGSNFYVANLTEEEGVKINSYLNFDMIASPNFVRSIYDGDGDAFDLVGPPGSDVIEEMFEKHFDRADLAHEPTEFSGRSDYLAFINVGIPAGGLFTGAEVIKSEEQAEIYGGIAGMQFDPCYHQACDTFFNISDEALGQNGDAIADVVAKLARSTKAIDDAKEAAEPPGRKVGRRSFAYRGGHLAR